MKVKIFIAYPDNHKFKEYNTVMTKNSINDITQQQWPIQVEEKYERIGLLGQGAFGGVYLARSKSKNSIGDDKVAIKFIDVSTVVAKSYAEREIAILSEINHPNSISLIESFDCITTKSSKCLVLALAQGPTIDRLLKVGGALGLPLAKLICEQLLNVVTYLHSHAVIHRDLKPDNLILVGGYDCNDYDDDIWEDDVNTDDKKWKLVLVDYGFARALHPDELELNRKQQQHNNCNNEETKNNYTPIASLNLPLDSTIGSSSSNHKKNRRLSMSRSKHKNKYASDNSNVLDHSYSRNVLEMSAIGSKGYTAPEVYNGARKNTTHTIPNSSSHFGNTYRNHSISLAPCVADYSMSSDGFSVGCILRHIYTGVPPNTSVEEYVSLQSNPFLLLIKYLSYCSTNANKRKKYRISPRIRYNDEVPKDIFIIIRGLTTSDTKDRLSVRACYRRLLPFDYDGDEVNSSVISYLKCATSFTNGMVATEESNECNEKNAIHSACNDDGNTKEMKTAPILVCKES